VWFMMKVYYMHVSTCHIEIHYFLLLIHNNF
jgi:hypothetical protein